MITIDNVSMRFYLGREKISSLKEYFIRRVKRNIKIDEFWALRDISFTIEDREVFGIIGLNGAGKSTLLKTIAGVLKPTTGKVSVHGTISPLIELGAGFDFELTARENIYLNGAVLGYQKKFISDRFEEMVEFSELRQFIDVPLKNYSSGMVARLAFAIATIVQPEILIVDEILSVGDVKFQHKSEEKMKAMMQGGATVIFVSHSIEKIKELCDKVLWLEGGRIMKIGKADDVCDEFSKATSV
jgi:ABC-2 type transport system ATP-binding protein